MTKITAMLIAALLAGLATEAAATGKKTVPELNRVTLGSKPSRGDIEASCSRSGGFSYGTATSSGEYGCINFDNNTAVECDGRGQCTGLSPR